MADVDPRVRKLFRPDEQAQKVANTTATQDEARYDRLLVPMLDELRSVVDAHVRRNPDGPDQIRPGDALCVLLQLTAEYAVEQRERRIPVELLAPSYAVAMQSAVRSAYARAVEFESKNFPGG